MVDQAQQAADGIRPRIEASSWIKAPISPRQELNFMGEAEDPVMSWHRGGRHKLNGVTIVGVLQSYVWAADVVNRGKSEYHSSVNLLARE
ncbi:hypothetical protein H5410_022165 [Solanum commersonii]|uniref:Uncharacterized protein n=1 Tax=Solanum commersonii TaxID=4109 RepID=A0A9J5ZH97_SOLCO|nr:hypothetical protein H5410_022165 [Solanum commersonii]